MPQSSLNRTAAAIAAAAAFLAGSSASSLAASDSAIFAGGCFWCVESDFDSVDGVLSTVSGYIGGNLPNPTYKDVTRGNSGHYEAVKIEFDPEVVEFRELADKFFRSVDPTDDGGQFCDRGDSYRTAIFANDDSQRMIALAARDEAETGIGHEDRDSDPRNCAVLPSRGLPPGLLSGEKPGNHQVWSHQAIGSLQALPRGLRPGCPGPTALGQPGCVHPLRTCADPWAGIPSILARQASLKSTMQ